MDVLLKIASLIQFNNKAEAEAIEYYTELLKETTISDLEVRDKEIISDVINEIISDELNHQIKLQKLYTMLTSIEPNKE